MDHFYRKWNVCCLFFVNCWIFIFAPICHYFQSHFHLLMVSDFFVFGLVSLHVQIACGIQSCPLISDNLSANLSSDLSIKVEKTTKWKQNIIQLLLDRLKNIGFWFMHYYYYFCLLKFTGMFYCPFNNKHRISKWLLANRKFTIKPKHYTFLLSFVAQTLYAPFPGRFIIQH